LLRWSYERKGKLIYHLREKRGKPTHEERGKGY